MRISRLTPPSQTSKTAPSSTPKPGSKPGLWPTLGIQMFVTRRALGHEKSNEGLTLMEAVVAIAVVALTGALITPPLFLAAATRVQNRRSEQALQIAQGEIDRIRTLVEQSEHEADKLPVAVAGRTFDGTVVDPPTIVLGQLKSVDNDCNTYDGGTVPITSLLPIDVDGDCDADFFMQSFRTTSPLEIDNKPSDFEVGVRVYTRSAVNNLNQGGQLSAEPASLKYTTGEGNQREFPLSVLYTQITWSDRDFSLYCYHGTSDCED